MNEQIICGSVLVYGGCRSGKSAYAQSLAHGRVCYIATASAGDEEMSRRIKKHRAQRPADWETVETLLDIDTTILACKGKFDAILIDCMSLFLYNLITLHDLDIPNGFELCTDDLISHLQKILSAAKAFGKNVIFVSNETGQGIVPDNRLGRFYRDVSGVMNQTLAHSCDHVIKVEVGIPIPIKKP